MAKKQVRCSIVVDVIIRSGDPPTPAEVIEHLNNLARDFEENSAVYGGGDDPWVVEEVRHE
jgi:hypothetical protein